jgi:hypothetical protein
MAAFAGTPIAAHVPVALQARSIPSVVTRSNVLPLLFWQGAELCMSLVGATLGTGLATLLQAGLLVAHGDLVRAPHALIAGTHAWVPAQWPLVASEASVPWFDDSTHHLLGAMPARRMDRDHHWLDVGAGTATLALLRSDPTALIHCIEYNETACQLAALGIGLAGRCGISVTCASVFDVALPQRHYQTVTCNAPLPSPDDQHGWRFGSADFVSAFLRQAQHCVAHNRTVVLHAGFDCNARRALDSIAGQSSLVMYANQQPINSQSPTLVDFGVLWWRPHGPTQRIVQNRQLTDRRPHIDDDDQPSWYTP